MPVIREVEGSGGSEELASSKSGEGCGPCD